MEERDLLLKYNLQWFAKEGPGGEKTEPATAKKLKDAREEGKRVQAETLSKIEKEVVALKELASVKEEEAVSLVIAQLVS